MLEYLIMTGYEVCIWVNMSHHVNIVINTRNIFFPISYIIFVIVAIIKILPILHLSYGIIICIIATFSAIQEGHFIRIWKEENNENRTNKYK